MQLGGADAVLDEALRMVLLHRDGSLGECERLIAEMLALRDQWGELVPLGSQELSDAYLDSVVLPQIGADAGAGSLCRADGVCDGCACGLSADAMFAGGFVGRRLSRTSKTSRRLRYARDGPECRERMRRILNTGEL